MTDKQQPEALLPPDIFGCDPAVVQVDAATTQHLVQALRIQRAEIETLTLYKNLADEYGLSIFKDLKDLTTEIENLRAKLKTHEDLGDAGSDVQLLRMGYAAARLEIESLRKEHADELAVAYMCGASREKELAAQQEPSCTSVQLAEMVLSDCGHSSNYTPLLNRVAARIDAHVERCLESKKTTQQEAQEPVAWNSLTDEDRERAMNSMPDMLEGFMKTWGWLHFAKAIEAICREKNAQPSPAAQGDALDAARYRWLRQEHERVDPVCHLTWKRNLQRDSSEWVNTAVLDTAIDKARKQGANHD